MFEISKDQLLKFSDVDLRELVARLCEAELRRAGAPVSALKWGGAQTTPDGGVDIDCRIENQVFAGDFVPRARTAIQVKKSSMPASKISNEMSPRGILRPIFSDLAASNGCYIIVSLRDDPTGPLMDDRKKSMQAQIEAIKDIGNLQTEFYGRGDLANWLRQHPGVELWAREKLGLTLNGWRPYGRWSRTPPDVEDTLICEAGVVIVLPEKEGRKLDIAQGINEIRELARESGKAVRIAGLSGVGKTRLVQALFENSVGNEPLDKHLAIYADLGEAPDPSPRAVLDQFIAEKRSAIIILDNCPSGAHNQLAGDVSAVAHIGLITVEYDIQDDKPGATRVVQIKAEGPDIAETLVKRRYPGLGQVNAQRVAEFSGGNARLALTLADAVRDEGSLSTFSDRQLFERLFYQRGAPDPDFLMVAETLALVYSFATNRNQNGVDELSALARLLGQDRRELYRATQTLVRRQLAQKRGDWSAILPHAVSNRLASKALENIPVDDILDTFQALPHRRLLISFGKRLGYLHDHAISRGIIRSWLSPGGLLQDLSKLDDDSIQLLVNVSPVASQDVLSAIEAQDADRATNTFFSTTNRYRYTFVNLLALIAYDTSHFSRCVSLLAKFVLAELGGEKHTSDQLFGLFSICRSGTEADPATREQVVRQYLFGSNRNEQRLGMGMLTAALKTDYSPSSSTLEFGARPRSYGYYPKSIEEQDQWFFRFLALAEEIAVSDDVEHSDEARKLVADELRNLWDCPGLSQTLVAMANNLNNQRAWLQGWRAVRAIKYYNRRNGGAHEIQNEVALLDELEEILRPQQLSDEVRMYVLSAGHQQFTLDDEFDFDDSNKWEESDYRAAANAHELGFAVAQNPTALHELSTNLFTAQSGYFFQFGEGLAEQSTNLRALWTQLVEWLELTEDRACQCGVLIGVLHILHQSDKHVASEILDAAVDNPVLRKFIVNLHTSVPLGRASIQRLLKSLDYHDTPLPQFEGIPWRPHFSALNEADIRILMRKVLGKPNGPEVVLKGLAMRFHGLTNDQLALIPKIRSLGLAASTAQLRSTADVHYGPMHEHYLSQVLVCCMNDNEFPEGSNEVLDAYFIKLKASSGYLGSIENVVPILAEKATIGFLDGIFLDPTLDDHRRNMVFREMRRKKNPLCDVDFAKLLTWCRQSDFQKRLAMVAQSIFPFENDKDDGTTVFTEQTLAIIESSNIPSIILSKLLCSVRPNAWEGSRTRIIENRRHAFETLTHHDRLDIAAAAKTCIARLMHWENQEREREQKYDRHRRESAQRFE